MLQYTKEKRCPDKYIYEKNLWRKTIMKNVKRVLAAILCVCLLCSNTVVFAHSGRTDSSGGHHDYKNKSGLGSYHYHCDGNPPHLHKNGNCPYSSKPKTSSASKPKPKSKYYSAATVRKVQKKLNKLGYKCGKADGSFGTKTKSAIKKYQKEKKIKSSGKINKTLLKKLDISSK